MSIDEASIQEELKEAFGLSEDPFSARVNAFYDGAQRLHNLETIRHLSIFGDMVLLLSGDHGSGKTTIIERFSKNFSDEIQIVRLSAGGGSERIHSVLRLAAISGLEVSPKEPYRDVLEHLVDQFTLSFEKTGKRTLLIIDDAHALPEQELSLYLQVIAPLDAESGVVLMLSGLPSLTSIVNGFEHPDQREWLHQIQLKPLSSEEVHEYLRCRLEAAGFVGEAVVSDAKLKQLAKLAQGNPASINNYFALVALGKTEVSEERDDIRSGVPQAALFSIALLIVFSFVFVSYQHGFFEFDTEDKSVQEVLGAQELATLKQKEQRLARIERAIEQVQRPGQMPVQVDGGLPGTASLSVSSAEEESRRLAETEMDGSSILPEEVSRVVSDIREESLTSGELVSESISPEQGSAAITQADEGSTRALEVSEPLSSQDDELVEGKLDADTPLPAESQSDLPVAPTKVEKPYFRPATWVLAQNDSAYTAQVLGSYNETTAEKFVRRHVEEAPALFYIESRYKGKPWYVVLYGVYPGKLAAKSAIDGAHAPIRKQKPWLRSYKGLKESLPPS